MRPHPKREWQQPPAPETEHPVPDGRQPERHDRILEGAASDRTVEYTTPVAMTHPKRDLDRLNALLHEQGDPDEAMSLGVFDGFVAGLIVCPEMIPPSEWMPEVLGGG